MKVVVTKERTPMIPISISAEPTVQPKQHLQNDKEISNNAKITVYVEKDTSGDIIYGGGGEQMRLMASSTASVGYGEERFRLVGPRLGSFDLGFSSEDVCLTGIEWP